MKNLLLLFTFISLSYYGATAQETFLMVYGPHGDVGGGSIQQTADKGYLLLPWNQCECLGKIDSMGALVGLAQYSSAPPGIIIPTADGGYFITGASMIKIDLNLIPQWGKQYSIGSSKAFIKDAKQTNDHGYIMAGVIVSSSGPATNGLLMKVDSAGSIQWSESFGGASMILSSVRPTNDGGYIVAADSVSTGGGIVMKTNSTGVVQWSTMYGGAKDEFYSIRQTSDAGYILTGFSRVINNFTAFVLKTDSTGISQWIKGWSNSVAGDPAVAGQTSDGGYVVGGSRGSYANSSETGSDSYLFKLDNTNNLAWAKKYDGTGGHGLTPTSDGGYALTGDANLSQKGILVSKTDANGNSCAATDFVPVFTTPTLPPTTLSLAGNTITFTETVLTISPVTVAINDTTYCVTTGINTPEKRTNAITVFPNPSSGSFKIIGAQLNSKLEIFNMLGEKIYSEILIDENVEFNAIEGIYFLKVSDGGKVFTQKLVIE